MRFEVRQLRQLGFQFQPHGGELLHLDIQVLGHVLELGHELTKLRAIKGWYALGH
ncbi:hypothetical protein GCM10007928_47910 [Sulfitobacter porphyrae]|nr:hypothetical protein GCM10007928_47910 [Sulfitobacter porphyrae]